MELRRLIPTGIAASAVGHLSVLAMVMIFAEVHPFGSVTAEPIAVDIVSADEAKPAPKPEETPLPPKADASDAFNLSSKSAPSSTPVPSPAQQAAPQPQPQKQAALSTARPAQQAAAQPLPQQTSPSPSYAPPEPDLAIKYHVMLGLPPELPPRARPVKSGDGFDGEASQKADIASSLVTEFRRHLRTCSKLPASITPADNVMIKLRVLMTPEGRLAAEPVVAEGSANPKALDLKQSAVEALQACQPYTMLPADRYGEWKVLDLSFTPQDFAG